MTNWMIAFCVLALLVALLWPTHGLVARWRAGRQRAARVRREDAIKHILKCEVNGGEATILAGHLQIPTDKTAELLENLEDRGLLSLAGGHLRLNSAGRELGLHLIRAHRLWESYLSEQTGVAEAEWHQRAEQQEHLLTPDQTDALAARLGNPTQDPHGDEIPARGESVAGDRGMVLSAAEPNQPLLVTHVEDEPATVYSQIAAQGIRRGMRGLIVEKLPHRIIFWSNGDEHVLAPIVANNISVEPLPDCTGNDLLEEEYLSGLKLGESGKVLGLSPACRGQERRRLLDLGFVPGTEVMAEMKSPGGDPTAFRVRGTLIALRREQAALVQISTPATV